MNVHKHINNLIEYAKANLRLDVEDELFAKNAVMNLLNLHTDTAGEDESADIFVRELEVPDSLVAPLTNYAIQNGIVKEEDRTLFETAIMGAVTPMPSMVNRFFEEDYKKIGAHGALLGLYDLGIKSNYIKLTDIRRNLYWKHSGDKCELEVTVNLSKPEKDNKEIARLKNAPATGYPKCMLCKENVGYAGRLGFPARQTLRFVPITLNNEKWYLQYSPYMYYNEHCIIFSEKHSPMTMNALTFKKLLEFVKLFPMYIAGSNACLPIVGGSILSHEHYQGGGHLMPVHFTKERWRFESEKFEGVTVAVQEWYNSDIRLYSDSIDKLVKVADYIHEFWKEYTDEEVGIIAKTTDRHNAITPIARYVDGKYSLDLLLRNNRTDEKYPDGIFHAHPEYHNIKKEGIGLIEAMGLFILPGRLDKEFALIENVLLGEDKFDENDTASPLYKHRDMIIDLSEKSYADRESAREEIKSYVGTVCESILKNTAVFKDDEQGKLAFLRFMEKAGFKRK